MDQDVLNVLATGQSIELPWQWNAQRAADYSQAKIVHFTQRKPNSEECHHPERGEYMKLRAMTPWANAPLRSKRDRRLHRVKNSVMKRVRALFPGL
jgi:lipopolysaccharide biosynthesis glycosyltransferase